MLVVVLLQSVCVCDRCECPNVNVNVNVIIRSVFLFFFCLFKFNPRALLQIVPKGKFISEDCLTGEKLLLSVSVFLPVSVSVFFHFHSNSPLIRWS